MEDPVKPSVNNTPVKHMLYQSDKDPPMFRDVGPGVQGGSAVKNAKELDGKPLKGDMLKSARVGQPMAPQANVQHLDGMTFIGAEKRGLPASETSMRTQAIRTVGLNQIMVAGHPPYSGRLWP